MAIEYRVVWKRNDLKQKTKKYTTLRGAKRFMILLGDEPWKAFDHDPEDYICCSGSDCGCGGQTVRNHFLRKDQPKIEFVRLEQREVGEWK